MYLVKFGFLGPPLTNNTTVPGFVMVFSVNCLVTSGSVRDLFEGRNFCPSHHPLLLPCTKIVNLPGGITITNQERIGRAKSLSIGNLHLLG